MKKIMSILCAAALLLACLAGCGSGKTDPAETEPPTESAEPTETPDATETPTETAAPTRSREEAYADYAADTVVATVNGTDVTWDSFFGAAYQYILTLQNNYGITDLSAELTEGYTMEQWVIDCAKDYLSQIVAINEKAAELGISVTDEELADIAEDLQTYADTYVEGDVDQLLRDNGMTEDFYYTQVTASLLYNKMFEHFYGVDGENLSDEDAIGYAKDAGYLHAKHILLKTVDDSRQPLDDETIAEKKAQAEALLAELKNCPADELEAKFDALIEEYSEDYTPGYYPDGYYFQEGTMVDAFYNAALALDEGAVSEIVESEFGYHILFHPAFGADHVFTYDSSYQPVTLRAAAADALFSNMSEEWFSAAEFSFKPEFESFSLVELFAVEE